MRWGYARRSFVPESPCRRQLSRRQVARTRRAARDAVLDLSASPALVSIVALDADSRP
jgi:hypothetical protein